MGAQAQPNVVPHALRRVVSLLCCQQLLQQKLGTSAVHKMYSHEDVGWLCLMLFSQLCASAAVVISLSLNPCLMLCHLPLCASLCVLGWNKQLQQHDEGVQC